MSRHFCVLFIAACTMWAVMFTLFLAACSNVGSGNDEQNGGSAKLMFGRLMVPLFDSISIHVSAENMESIHVSAHSVNDNIKIDGIPFGENRKFEAKIYADKGKLVQKILGRNHQIVT